MAQGIKIIIDIRKKGHFERNDLFDGGGMPSSHTAVVVAVAFVIGWIDGVNSHLFSLSLVIAAIVIYDALNIRYHAGEQARILNKITAKLSNHHDDIEPTQFKHPLGHTIPEVLGGTVVGVITSLLAFLIHSHLINWLQHLW
jgi:acid phosphatase family membrane protein YuiD